MKRSEEKAIRFKLVKNLNKNNRLSLAEVGMRDVLWGKGRRPDERDFTLPKWLRRQNA